MAEYLVQDTSLTSVADKIRVLSGTTGVMSLDNMKTHIDDANNTISSQSDTIAEITEVLNNIGTGGSAPLVETCTVELHVYDGYIAYATVDDSGNIITIAEWFAYQNQYFTIKIIKNTPLILQFMNANQQYSVSDTIITNQTGVVGSTFKPYLYTVSGDGVISYEFISVGGGEK